MAAALDYAVKSGMCYAKLCSIALLCAAACVSLQAQAQQTDPSNKPNVFLENKEKPPKPSNARTISGMVKDEKDNPISGAIVQIKDMKTSKVVDFATKADGKFIFRDLHMDIDYELDAKHDGITSPVKKVSIYDTRHDIVLMFKLEPPSAAKETER